MQSPCGTCGGEFPLVENGKHAGNCDVCHKIYTARDAREEREKNETAASSLIGKGFAVQPKVKQ